MRLNHKLSLAFALAVLLTVALISVLANVLIDNEFKKYIVKQQEQRTQEIITSMGEQYSGDALGWDLNFVHIIGMHALYDGYIVRLEDAAGRALWDAQACDMNSCARVMNDISQRMGAKYPQINGEFISRDFPLLQNGEPIGTVNIRYFGPYFLSENDFRFLDALNILLIVIGSSCLLLSVGVGVLMSRRISDPISRVALAARELSRGNYQTRIASPNNTKELGELVESINGLAESLSRQEALRKQLTADVSHELRTPVTSIQTHLEAMMEGIWEPTRERLMSCYEEALRIGALIKDLESLARIDDKSITLGKKRVSLSRIWGKVIDSFAVDIKNKGLTVALTGDAPEIAADEDRVRQVAVNLLSNAVKYTSPGGRIHVALSETEQCAVFTVSDDGIGIPEDELPFIFERFYRADKSRNRKTGGAGIGLAVVKSIVAAHGGTVTAESRLEHGSRFIVSLPK